MIKVERDIRSIADKILKHLEDGCYWSVAELSEAIGQSRGAVDRSLAFLLGADLVEVDEGDVYHHESAFIANLWGKKR